MTGDNQPVLLIGGPRDGDYFTVDSAYRQFQVLEMKRPNWQTEYMKEVPIEYARQTHTYYRHSFGGEMFMIHETLFDSGQFPRNVFAALKNGYKVIK